MADQLELSFASPCPVERQGAIWVVSTDIAVPAPLLQDGSHLFLDGFSGAPAARDGDLILLKEGRGDSYRIFSAGRPLGADDVIRYLSGITERARTVSGSQVQDLVLLSFVRGSAPAPRPGLSTGLGQALSTLRSRTLRASSTAVESLCRYIDEGLPNDRHPALDALLGREVADARSRSECGPAQGVKRDYARAALLFRRVSMHGHERATGRALRTLSREWDAQLVLPFGDQGTRARISRLGYQARRALGTRISVAVTPFGGSPSRPPIWRSCASVSLSNLDVCKLLSGVDGRTLDAAVQVKAIGWTVGERVWRVRAGFDTELAVLLGVAGETGPKEGFFKASIRGKDCTILPRRSISRVGALAEFTVSAASDTSIVIELSTDVDRYLSIDVELAGCVA